MRSKKRMAAKHQIHEIPLPRWCYVQDQPGKLLTTELDKLFLNKPKRVASETTRKNLAIGWQIPQAQRRRKK